MREHIVVFLWGFVPATLWLGYWVIGDLWRERWTGKYQGSNTESAYWHKTDLEAFLCNFVDHTHPNICWWKVIVTPFIVGLVVSMIWWLIYTTVVMV